MVPGVIGRAGPGASIPALGHPAPHRALRIASALLAALAMAAATAGPVLAVPPEGSWGGPVSLAFTPGETITATLLADGRVLQSNASRDRDSALSEERRAQVFDPRSGAWQEVSRGHSFPVHVADALLPDGRLLMVDRERKAYIYDPVSDTLGGAASPVGDGDVMDSFTLTTLPAGPPSACGPNCGRVLLAGGCDFGPAVGELYDPARDRWGPPIPMIGPERCRHSATLLPGGRVLIAGGTNLDRERVIRSAELFDPLTSTFVPTGSPHYNRFTQSATRLADGRVLVVGESPPTCPPGRLVNGCFTPNRERSAELYDPGTGRWTETGDTLLNLSPNPGNGGFATAALGDGRVLLVVGASVPPAEAPPAPSQLAELYDPATGRWSSAASAAPPLTRVRGTITLDRTPCEASCGRVVVIGVSDSRLYTPSGPLTGRAAGLAPPSGSAVTAPSTSSRLPLVGGVALIAIAVLGVGVGVQRRLRSPKPPSVRR